MQVALLVVGSRVVGRTLFSDSPANNSTEMFDSSRTSPAPNIRADGVDRYEGIMKPVVPEASNTWVMITSSTRTGGGRIYSEAQ